MRKPKFWNVIGWLCIVSWVLKIAASILAGVAKGLGSPVSMAATQNMTDPTLLLITAILAFAYSDYLNDKQKVS